MILCCGEALIDMIPAVTADGRGAYVPHPGGAVFNTAIALGRLGAGAGLLTGLSTDLFGGQLAQALDASGVDASLAVSTDRPTTLAFVQLVEGQARYSFFDENSAGRMLAPTDFPALPAFVDALFFGGISLACLPGAEAYADLAIREATGRVIMLDPNIRPGFITDEPAYRARLDRMLGLADIVKVSDEDLHWLMPGAGSLEEKACKMLAVGPTVVIVTRGADGAIAATATGLSVSVRGKRVKVADTVGAGDTFNAGVLFKLAALELLDKEALRHLTVADLHEVLSFGATVAAVTVSRHGANPPWAAEL